MAKIFVSHSKFDKQLVNKLKKQIEQVGITPILYGEQLDRQDGGAAASDDIYNKLSSCEGLMVLLGPSVAARPHTQTWIGFETGITYALQKRAEEKRPEFESHYPLAHSIWLLEDVGQTYDAAIPHVDYAYLFRFEDSSQWENLQVIAKILASKVGLNQEHLEEINHARSKLFIVNFKCPYKVCRATYELHISKGGSVAEHPQSFVVKCSVCRQRVRVFQEKNRWQTERADYAALVERIEDLEDIIAMKDALLAPQEEATTWEEYKLQRAARVHSPES